jgi:citrate lyase subunit beta / citryl-CoA lyase
MATTLATPIFHAGRRGDKIRGDVWMGFLPADSGGLLLDFTSKLESMYGQSTRDLLLTLCNEAGVEHGTLFVEDKGAYPFVLRARLESLLQQVLDDSGLRLHHEAPLGDGLPPVEPKRMRRSRLYLPGNEAKYMLNAALHEPDGIILDLEDSVAPAAKFDARAMVRHALHCLDFGDCERMVRINQGEMGMEDLAYLSDAPFHLVLIPKVETAEEVQALEPIVADRDLLFMPIIESAKGVMNADAIAKASPRIVALTLGLEDLTADLGVVKTPGGMETAFACSWVIHAAKANGLQAIDSVYGNIADEKGLRHSLREAKAKGFEGKGCVHPRQIRVVHEEFAPSAAEIDRACKITLAFEDAETKGLGVVSLGSKMIDPPVVKRALTVVSSAIRAGLIEENWRTNIS